MDTGLSILFRINADDNIIFFNNEWSKATALNNSCEILGDIVLHQSLWDFLKDIKVEYLYRKMLLRVRQGHRVKFNFRCDYADSIQLLEMNISLQNNDEVLFEVCLMYKDFQPPQDSSNDALAQTEEMLVVCSWCNRVNTENEDWEEVEIAVNTLKLFEFQNLPQISHGMCNNCYQAYLKNIPR